MAQQPQRKLSVRARWPEGDLRALEYVQRRRWPVPNCSRPSRCSWCSWWLYKGLVFALWRCAARQPRAVVRCHSADDETVPGLISMKLAHGSRHAGDSCCRNSSSSIPPSLWCQESEPAGQGNVVLHLFIPVISGSENHKRSSMQPLHISRTLQSRVASGASVFQEQSTGPPGVWFALCALKPMPFTRLGSSKQAVAQTLPVRCSVAVGVCACTCIAFGPSCMIDRIVRLLNQRFTLHGTAALASASIVLLWLSISNSLDIMPGSPFMAVMLCL